jgi:hypothetical protein
MYLIAGFKKVADYRTSTWRKNLIEQVYVLGFRKLTFLTDKQGQWKNQQSINGLFIENSNKILIIKIRY